MKVTVKSTSEAEIVESFRTAASQAYRSALDLQSFFNRVVIRMDEGYLAMTEGLPSTAEAYTRADARMKNLFQLLPKDVDFSAIQAMLHGEFVGIEIAEKVN